MLKKLSVVCILSVASVHLSADVIPDSSVGTQVKMEGSDFGITHGRREGTNLFHSFRDFSIGTEESATFIKYGIRAPNDIRNILARVTGSNESEIFGLLKSNFDGANLYLMNPNGIIFGKNASLDVRGSFHATTADYLRLGKDDFFYADVSKKIRFISAAPAAFGFLGEQLAPIDIKGENVWLTVPDEKTLSMIGGDITITDSILYAPSGRINLVAIASEGEVEKDSLEINAIQKGKINLSHFSGYREVEVDGKFIVWGAYYDDDGNLIEEVYASYGNLDVSNHTKTADAGQIFIRGGQFFVTKAGMFADTYEYKGEQKANTGINIAIDGDINLIDNAVITADNRQTVTQRKSGDITITAANLTFQQTKEFDDENEYFIDEYLGIISTDSFGPGTAGDITLKLTGSLNLNPGSIVSIAQSYEVEGNGGNIQIEAKKVILQNSGMIAVDTFGENAGNITITATDNISLRDIDLALRGGISASTEEGSIGKGGNIELNAPNLILDAGEIWALSKGSGNAGSITINTNTALLTNKSRISAKADFAIGGNINFNVQNLLHITDYSKIIAEAFGEEQLDSGGNISVVGKPPFFILGKYSGLDTTGYVGDGGNIHISAKHFIESSTSWIDASSTFGRDGEVWINASQEDFSKDLTLPKKFPLIDKFSLSRCALSTSKELSRFFIITRDVLPPSPTDLKTHLYFPQ